MKFIWLINVKCQQLLVFKHLKPDNYSIWEIDLKQETSSFVSILVFMSSWIFVLWVEHEKSFITLGPEDLSISSDLALIHI